MQTPNMDISKTIKRLKEEQERERGRIRKQKEEWANRYYR